MYKRKKMAGWRTEMKKKIAALILCVCMAALALSGCGSSGKKTLRVYNAGEYIDKTLLSKF